MANRRGFTWVSDTVMARFEIGDPIIGFCQRVHWQQLFWGASTYFALMRNTRVVQFADEVVDELNKVT